MTPLIEFFRQPGKIRAFAAHLAISAALVSALAAVVYFVWYPPPYFEFDGGWTILRMVILVDVVIGPLLTLIVFRRGKKELKRDLGIIGALQLMAFIYGVGLMMEYRPAFVVYAEKNFYSVPWPDLVPNTRDLPRLEAMRSGRGPAMVALMLPEDPATRQGLWMSASTGGPRVTVLGDYYQPITPAIWRGIVPDALDLNVLMRAEPNAKDDLERFRRRFLEGSTTTFDKLAFYPAVFRYGVVMFAFDRETGGLFGWVTE
jgi:hypothetical protein